MDTSRNDLLGEIARDAELERSDFLVQATEQLNKFLKANRERVAELGGLTLIDDDPDYLSIAPDLTFRSRTRYLDDLTNEWTSETEVIETAAELVELYNPADLYSAFAEAAREAAGMPPEPTAEGDLLDVLSKRLRSARLVPLLADRPLVAGTAAAYVCRGMVCDLPATTVEDLVQALTPPR